MGGRETFSISDSSTSDGHLDNDVKHVAAVLIHVLENDDIEHLAQVSDDDSMNINGSHGRQSESSVLPGV